MRLRRSVVELLLLRRSGVADAVAPTLSSAQNGTETADGSTNFGVSTNEGNGTLYWAILTNGGSATDAQIKAGSGGNIVAGKAGNQAVTTTGAQTVASVTGLTGLTDYEIVFLQRDAAGNDSAQAEVGLTTLAGFTAPAASLTGSGTTVTITATTNFDLSSGRFGAAIAINGGVATWYDGAGATAGAQSVVLALTDIGAVAGDLIGIDPGYSLTDPAVDKVYASDSGLYITPSIATPTITGLSDPPTTAETATGVNGTALVSYDNDTQTSATRSVLWLGDGASLGDTDNTHELTADEGLQISFQNTTSDGGSNVSAETAAVVAAGDWANVVLQFGNDNAANGTAINGRTASDQSVNGVGSPHAFTSSGATYVSAEAPVGMTTSIWSALGTNFSDESADYTLGTGDFVIDIAFLPSALGNSRVIFIPKLGNGYQIFHSATDNLSVWDGSNVIIADSGALSAQWYLIRLARVSGTLTLYADADGADAEFGTTVVGTPVSSSLDVTQTQIAVGSAANGDQKHGHYASLRITKGSGVNADVALPFGTS